MRQQAASPQPQAPPHLTCTTGPNTHPPVPGQRRTLSRACIASSAVPTAGSRSACCVCALSHGSAGARAAECYCGCAMLLTSCPLQVAKRKLVSGSGARSRPPECARPGERFACSSPPRLSALIAIAGGGVKYLISLLPSLGSRSRDASGAHLHMHKTSACTAQRTAIPQHQHAITCTAWCVIIIIIIIIIII